MKSAMYPVLKKKLLNEGTYGFREQCIGPT